MSQRRQDSEAPASGPQGRSDPFERLVRELDRGTRGVSALTRAAPEAILGALGIVLLCTGVALIVLAWFGVAHSRFLQQELAYIVSGGLLGLAFVMIGGFLYVGYLLVRQSRAFEQMARAIREDLDEQRELVPPVSDRRSPGRRRGRQDMDAAS
jgi:hypothetical protein